MKGICFDCCSQLDECVPSPRLLVYFSYFFALIRSIIFSLMCLPFFLSSFHLFLSSRVFSPGLCCCGLFYFLLFFFFLFFNVVLSLLSSHPFLCWFIMMSIKETCSGEAEVVSPLFFFFSKTPVCVIIKKEKSPSELSVTHFSNVYLQIHTHSFMGFPYFYSLIII